MYGRFFILGVLLLVGCASPSQKPSSTSSADVYHFNLRPYDRIPGINHELYNYLFNIIRNKLIFYVLESNPQASEPFGVVLELDISSLGRSLAERRNAPVIRGWFLFENDAVPVDSLFLEQYRAKNLPDTYQDLAKASFWVEKKDDRGTYRVFVRYWNKTVIREFLHEVKQTRNSYVITSTENL
ncbi:hypothetical protein [Thermospira aquatica]|uniref:Lipoprotein n=1 Tax=Thermospira aquatica TaxID=2828656 RepID=A0AAX3BER9_9SPIR|nr:hypothetical protein [Thermospira aquatica]URA10714.1 hypothetical protein KDW03_02610 [Thermospira aquatica]